MTDRWTLENVPSPPYDFVGKKLIFGLGWYVRIDCSDADEMIEPCCDSQVYGPFSSEDAANEAGFDLTNEVGPWYFRVWEVNDD